MLILYCRPACPFCQKVTLYAESAGISFDVKNINENPGLVQELVGLGGKRQVPYLVDEEMHVSMYESDDIIDYLKEHYES